MVVAAFDSLLSGVNSIERDFSASSSSKLQELLRIRLSAGRAIEAVAKEQAESDEKQAMLDELTELECRCSKIAEQIHAKTLNELCYKLSNWLLDTESMTADRRELHPSDALVVSVFDDLLAQTGAPSDLSELRQPRDVV